MNLAKRLALGLTGAILMVTPQGVVEAGEPSARSARPNVLLICVDDLKPLLGCYGAPIIRSPQIDRLAARGVVFDRAYCNQAVCSPSRNALLVGLRPSTIGIYDLATNFRRAVPKAVTLPEHFRRHGYRTEAIGKVFHVGHGNHEDQASWSVPHWGPKGATYVLPANLERLKVQSVLITRGEKGMSLFQRDGEVTHIPTMAKEVYDVTGAGDTAIAVLTLAMAVGASPKEAAILSNYAAGIVVQELGTATVKSWELEDAVRNGIRSKGRAPMSRG